MATMSILIGGVVLISLMVLAVSSGGGPAPSRLVLGRQQDLRAEIADGGPRYFASPAGDHGFYLSLVGNDLTAVVAELPGKTECEVRWRDSKGGFIDCKGNLRSIGELSKYDTLIGEGGKGGFPKDALVVDLRSPRSLRD